MTRDNPEPKRKKWSVCCLFPNISKKCLGKSKCSRIDERERISLFVLAIFKGLWLCGWNMGSDKGGIFFFHFAKVPVILTSPNRWTRLSFIALLLTPSAGCPAPLLNSLFSKKKKEKKVWTPPGISRDKDKMKIIQNKTTNSNPELKMSVLFPVGNIRQLSSNEQLVTVQLNSWLQHQFLRSGLFLFFVFLRIDKMSLGQDLPMCNSG